MVWHPLQDTPAAVASLTGVTLAVGISLNWTRPSTLRCASAWLTTWTRLVGLAPPAVEAASGVEAVVVVGWATPGAGDVLETLFTGPRPRAPTAPPAPIRTIAATAIVAQRPRPRS